MGNPALCSTLINYLKHIRKNVNKIISYSYSKAQSSYSKNFCKMLCVLFTKSMYYYIIQYTNNSYKFIINKDGKLFMKCENLI